MYKQAYLLIGAFNLAVSFLGEYTSISVLNVTGGIVMLGLFYIEVHNAK